MEFTIVLSPQDINFLNCAICNRVTAPFALAEHDQYACDCKHFICPACAATTNICPTCHTQITPVITLDNGPTRSPIPFIRKLIKACPNAPCSFFTLCETTILYHTLCACPFRPISDRHSAISIRRLLKYTESDFCIIDNIRKQSVKLSFPTQHAVPVTVVLTVDRVASTITPIFISHHVAIVMNSRSSIGFHLLVPATKSPIKHRFPVDEHVTLTVIPLFQSPHPDPNMWPETYRSLYACVHTVAHWSTAFVAHFQHYIHHAWHPEAAAAIVPFTPAKPISVGVAPALFATITNALYFSMTQTKVNDPFVFRIASDDNNTLMVAQCPSCFAYLPFTEFCAHINIDSTATLQLATRVDIRPTLNPCAKRLWVADLAHELQTPVIREQMDIFPMLPAIRALIEFEQPIPTYYGIILKILNRTKLVALSLNKHNHTICALCDHYDPTPSIPRIAEHYNISLDQAKNFTEMLFTHTYTQYTFLPGNIIPEF